MQGLSIPGLGTHDVVFICTEHDSVYAFDADSNSGSNAQPLWFDNFGPSVPNGDTGTGDINPEVGITSTPVIGSVTGGGQVLYVVSKTKTLDTNGNPVYTQRLHALSVTTGAEQLGGPVVIQGTVPGTGDASVNGQLTFNPLIQHNRPGLLLVTSAPRTPNALTKTVSSVLTGTSVLYIAYASHGDNGPYHGWVFAYNPLTLAQLGILNTTPNALTDPSGYPLAAGGIWQSGAGLASDGKSVFFSTGNGSFNPANGSYGDSDGPALQLEPIRSPIISPRRISSTWMTTTPISDLAE